MKVLTYILILIIIMIVFISSANILNAQDDNPTQIAQTSAQLNEVIQNQKLIITKLNELQKELQIVKIRASVKR